MAIGEKIRYARKCAGLSQEQLAEKMCVSRSAIAKWETGKGLPDIENLKILSRLLNVSVDVLLDDGTQPDSSLIREPYRLAAYGRGCKKVRKDRMMRQRFPLGTISTLLGRPQLAEDTHTLDSTLGFLTPVPFSMPEFMKSVRDFDRDFYLVEQNSEELFVTVTDSYLEIRHLSQPLPEKSFTLEGWIFVRCGYLNDN